MIMYIIIIPKNNVGKVSVFCLAHFACNLPNFAID